MVKKKAKPTRQQSVANKLVKQSEQNELLSKKIIKGDFFKLFIKK